uniref:pectinesterase n=1 Tax=Kalanchoe fedtschenkoi TaxID=63787 RepID=A0A7N0UTV7_KALFE
MLLLFSNNLQPSTAAAASSLINPSKTFIKTSCKKTSYPNVCYSSLSPYAPIVGTNLRKLVTVSLNVALKTAKNTSSAISKISKQKGLKKVEAAVVRDCVENVKDSIYEMRLCVKGLGNGSKKRIGKETMESIKTWMSAAITDEETCMDGFQGQKVKASVQSSIRKYMVKLVMVTSNALAIIDLLPTYS